MSASPDTICLGLLDDRDVSICLFDVGARNGINHIAGLARRVDAYGFEPNPSEFEKLINGTTDALRHGITLPSYRSLQYFQQALGNRSGTQRFYFRQGPGMAGMLPLNLDRLAEFRSHGGDAHFGEKMSALDAAIFDDAQAIDVAITTLDAFTQCHSVEHIDCLKIDVEGFEHEVLEGAHRTLSQTGVIVVETAFIPLHKGQKVFSDVDLLLREHGFDLLHHEIDQNQLGYKSLKTPSTYVPRGFFDPYAQPLLCDAVYINRQIADPDRCLAQGAVLLERRYADEAAFVLETKAGIAADTCTFLRGAGSSLSLGERLRRTGYQKVDQFVDCLSYLKKRISFRRGIR